MLELEVSSELDWSSAKGRHGVHDGAGEMDTKMAGDENPSVRDGVKSSITPPPLLAHL